VEPETPLLWVIRDTIGLTGTKYGCGIALCGSCTVHVNGKAVRSCVQPVSQAAGRCHDYRRTLAKRAASGAGSVAGRRCAGVRYCQPGQIMAAAALLAKNPNPTDVDITARSQISAAVGPTRGFDRRFTERRSLQ